MPYRDRLALLPKVKMQVFCVGDRFEMDKHKASNNNLNEANFQGEFNGIPAGENSQCNVPEHTIISNILTDLTFRRNSRRRAACLNNSL